MTEVQLPFKPVLKFLQEQMVSRLWIPLIGLRTNLSTRDGNYGQKKARLALDAMEGDSERTKISSFHHWINGEEMGHIESWKNSETLIHHSAYDELEEGEKEGKYSSESIESYFHCLNFC